MTKGSFMALAAGVALSVSLPATAQEEATSRFALPERPNFVIVVTDDQRWDTLWAMPYVDDSLRPLSLDFRHTYVTTPTCCPARASFLSGGFYSHNTGVLANSGPNGGAQAFEDLKALPVTLYRAGYRTALIGKYMNGYDEIAPYVPPGWSHFVGTVRSGNWRNAVVVIGSSDGSPKTGRTRQVDGHVVQFEFDEALRFLDTVGNEPFFLLVSTQAPHEPAVPQTQDARRFSDYLYRKRSWGEEDLSDKPRYVRRRASRFSKNLEASDKFHRDQLRSLRAVDRGIQALYERLAEEGLLASTVFVFTSDNGYVWGEHRLEGKNLPYDESIRVPLMVSMAGAATGESDHLVAMNLDLGATVLDLAGIYSTDKALARHTDGMSLRPLLEAAEPDSVEWREDLLIQSFSRGFAALLTRRSLGDVERPARAGWTWKYIEHEAGNPKEAYRSDVDRFETDSVDTDPEFRELYREPLAERLHQLMGLYLATDRLPAGRRGTKYRKELRATGAVEPYTWRVVDGQLPRGLRLQPKKGKIVGRPKEAGEFEISLRVEASSNARYLKRPQAMTRTFRLKIKE